MLLLSCQADFPRSPRDDEVRAVMVDFLQSAVPEPWWSNVPDSAEAQSLTNRL